MLVTCEYDVCETLDLTDELSSAVWFNPIVWVVMYANT